MKELWGRALERQQQETQSAERTFMQPEELGWHRLETVNTEQEVLDLGAWLERETVKLNLVFYQDNPTVFHLQQAEWHAKVKTNLARVQRMMGATDGAAPAAAAPAAAAPAAAAPAAAAEMTTEERLKVPPDKLMKEIRDDLQSLPLVKELFYQARTHPSPHPSHSPQPLTPTTRPGQLRPSAWGCATRLGTRRPIRTSSSPC